MDHQAPGIINAHTPHPINLPDHQRAQSSNRSSQGAHDNANDGSNFQKNCNRDLLQKMENYLKERRCMKDQLQRANDVLELKKILEASKDENIRRLQQELEDLNLEKYRGSLGHVDHLKMTTTRNETKLGKRDRTCRQCAALLQEKAHLNAELDRRAHEILKYKRTLRDLSHRMRQQDREVVALDSEVDAKKYELTQMADKLVDLKRKCDNYETTLRVFPVYQIMSVGKLEATLVLQQVLDTGLISLNISRWGFRQVVDLSQVTAVEVLSSATLLRDENIKPVSSYRSAVSSFIPFFNRRLERISPATLTQDQTVVMGSYEERKVVTHGGCVFELHTKSLGTFKFETKDQQSMIDCVTTLRQLMMQATEHETANEENQADHCFGALAAFFLGDDEEIPKNVSSCAVPPTSPVRYTKVSCIDTPRSPERKKDSPARHSTTSFLQTTYSYFQRAHRPLPTSNDLLDDRDHRRPLSRRGRTDMSRRANSSEVSANDDDDDHVRRSPGRRRTNSFRRIGSSRYSASDEDEPVDISSEEFIRSYYQPHRPRRRYTSSSYEGKPPCLTKDELSKLGRRGPASAWHEQNSQLLPPTPRMPVAAFPGSPSVTATVPFLGTHQVAPQATMSAMQLNVSPHQPVTIRYPTPAAYFAQPIISSPVDNALMPSVAYPATHSAPAHPPLSQRPVNPHLPPYTMVAISRPDASQVPAPLHVSQANGPQGSILRSSYVPSNSMLPLSPPPVGSRSWAGEQPYSAPPMICPPQAPPPPPQQQQAQWPFTGTSLSTSPKYNYVSVAPQNAPFACPSDLGPPPTSHQVGHPDGRASPISDYNCVSGQSWSVPDPADATSAAWRWSSNYTVPILPTNLPSATMAQTEQYQQPMWGEECQMSLMPEVASHSHEFPFSTSIASSVAATTAGEVNGKESGESLSCFVPDVQAQRFPSSDFPVVVDHSGETCIDGKRAATRRPIVGTGRRETGRGSFVLPERQYFPGDTSVNPSQVDKPSRNNTSAPDEGIGPPLPHRAAGTRNNRNMIERREPPAFRNEHVTVDRQLMEVVQPPNLFIGGAARSWSAERRQYL